MLANHGRAFHCAPVDFAAPREEDLVAMAKTDAKAFLQWRGQSALWLASFLQWAARSMVFWRDGRMAAKTAALEHEIANGSPYADAFRLALDLRHKSAAAADSFHDELQMHFENIAEDVALEMERLIERATIS